MQGIFEHNDGVRLTSRRGRNRENPATGSARRACRWPLSWPTAYDAYQLARCEPHQRVLPTVNTWSAAFAMSWRFSASPMPKQMVVNRVCWSVAGSRAAI
jgi:hypothetical protein